GGSIKHQRRLIQHGEGLGCIAGLDVGVRSEHGGGVGTRLVDLQAVESVDEQVRRGVGLGGMKDLGDILLGEVCRQGVYPDQRVAVTACQAKSDPALEVAARFRAEASGDVDVLVLIHRDRPGSGSEHYLQDAAAIRIQLRLELAEIQELRLMH